VKGLATLKGARMRWKVRGGEVSCDGKYGSQKNNWNIIKVRKTTNTEEGERDGV